MSISKVGRCRPTVGLPGSRAFAEGMSKMTGDMEPARLIADPDFRVGEVDPRLYGRSSSTSAGPSTAASTSPATRPPTSIGFRGDVLELVRELGVPLVRYPGGNFVSGYDWEDGVGPDRTRPPRLDLAWRSTETNAVGTDEFARWAKRAGADVNMAVNLGTRGHRRRPQPASNTATTRAAPLERPAHRQRLAASRTASRLWCLGNEMDGPWQIGHKTADEYGRLAAETAVGDEVDRSDDRAGRLRQLAPATCPTFPQWEATVLDHTYDHVDYISLHTYHRLPRWRHRQLPRSDRSRWRSTSAPSSPLCDYVKAKKRPRRP